MPSPGCLFNRLLALSGCGRLLALVELDVAATGVVAAQIATCEVAVGQLDFEYVIPARLAFVAHADSRSARLTVDRNRVVDDPAIRVIRINRVARDGRVFDVHARVMIDVVEVAPERAIFDTTRDTEIGLVP